MYATQMEIGNVCKDGQEETKKTSIAQKVWKYALHNARASY